MMRQPYFIAIALRYLGSRTQNAFISFISAVSMLGIAISVAVLIVVMAVVNGFETELEHRILSVVPDARLYGYDDPTGAMVPVRDWQTMVTMAAEDEHVLAAAPFVESAGLAIVGDRLLQVSVRGVDPDLEPAVTSLSEHVASGSFDALRTDWNIVIGQQLADELGVTVGDEIRLHVPEVRVTLVGAQNPNRVFTVGGIFDVGMTEFDRGLALISFDDAIRLYQTRGRASGISVRVDDVYNADAIVRKYGIAVYEHFEERENYLPEDWSYRYSNIFRSITLTKQILFIVLSLVMAIAVFNIISTLFMVVREKRGDIAILRTLGSSPRSILSVFIVQGSAIGLLGALGGLLLGLVLVVSLGPVVDGIEAVFAIDLLSADVYPIGDLPTEVRIGEIARICVLALTMAVLATIYPAYRASAQPPAEALRNE